MYCIGQLTPHKNNMHALRKCAVGLHTPHKSNIHALRKCDVGTFNFES